MSQRPSDPIRVDRLRALCLALPEASEKLSHGEAAWFVKGKQFANTADHHHDDRLSVWCAAPMGEQEMLVSADPVRFFRPPYVGHRGWLGVYLDGEVDWDELAAMIERAYRQVAPKRLSQNLISLPPSGGRSINPSSSRLARRARGEGLRAKRPSTRAGK